MLAAGLPLRVVALSAPGGYDTHDNQAKDLSDGLKLTADSLLAFQRDLEARGLADRVLVHVWTEFGRRAKENGSGGTDHGAAGTGFLIGSRVAGTMIGEFPGLAKLDDDGNLRATADFRGLYGAILEDWLGTDADAIIPGARNSAGRRSCDEAPRRSAGLRSRHSAVTSAAASPRSPARAQVSADEFTLALSRSSIHHGPAIIELVNFGEDDHDLALRRVGGTRTYRIGVVHPARRRARRAPSTGPVHALVHARRPPRPRHARDAAGRLSAGYQLPGDGGSSIPGTLIT